MSTKPEPGIAAKGKLLVIGGAIGACFVFIISNWSNLKDIWDEVLLFLVPPKVVVLVGPKPDDPKTAKSWGYYDWEPALNEIIEFGRKNNIPLEKELVDHTGNRPKLVFRKSEVADNNTSRELATKLCSDEDIVAVIGYVWSTRTGKAIEEFTGKKLSNSLENSQPSEICAGYDPLPLLIVGATSDYLTEINSNKDLGYKYPILQVAPSNAHQARQIASSLGDTFSSKKKIKILFVLDNDNEVNKLYSIDLKAQIEKAISEYQKFQFTKEELYSDKLYDWPELTKTFKSVDVVIIVGNTAMALRTIKGRDPTAIDGPIVIVTDGIVNNATLNQGTNKEPIWTTEAEHIWGSFPTVNHNLSHHSSPNFAVIAFDAVNILNSISLKGSGRPSRESIYKKFKNIVESNVSFRVDENHYRFDLQGKRAENLDPERKFFNRPLYHFSEVVAARSSEGKVKSLKWDHRVCRRSLFMDGSCDVSQSTNQIVSP